MILKLMRAHMSIMSWILLIAAIVAAIFSNEIDRAVNGNTVARKVILVFSPGIVCILLLPFIFRLL